MMTDEEFERYERGTCARKRRYSTRKHARQVAHAAHVIAREGRPMREYLCPYCYGYHLSSSPAREGRT